MSSIEAEDSNATGVGTKCCISKIVVTIAVLLPQREGEESIFKILVIFWGF